MAHFFDTFYMYRARYIWFQLTACPSNWTDRIFDSTLYGPFAPFLPLPLRPNSSWACLCLRLLPPYLFFCRSFPACLFALLSAFAYLWSSLLVHNRLVFVYPPQSVSSVDDLPSASSDYHLPC